MLHRFVRTPANRDAILELLQFLKTSLSYVFTYPFIVVCFAVKRGQYMESEIARSIPDC
jgi:hypothetical protein